MNLTKPALISVGVVGAMLAASAWAWPHASDLVPVHWSAADGAADRYGSRPEALLTLPAVAAGLALLMWVLPRAAPRNGWLERSGEAYVAIWLATLALLVLLHAGLVVTAVGGRFDMVRGACLGVGLLMAVIGNYLGKVRYNHLVGLRLPWTLASERVWDRTHRFAGPLVMAGGLVLAAVAVAAPSPPMGGGWLLPALLLCTLGPILAAAVYSWRLSREPGAA